MPVGEAEVTLTVTALPAPMMQVTTSGFVEPGASHATCAVPSRFVLFHAKEIIIVNIM